MALNKEEGHPRGCLGVGGGNQTNAHGIKGLRSSPGTERVSRGWGVKIQDGWNSGGTSRKKGRVHEKAGEGS